MRKVSCAACETDPSPAQQRNFAVLTEAVRAKPGSKGAGVGAGVVALPLSRSLSLLTLSPAAAEAVSLRLITDSDNGHH